MNRLILSVVVSLMMGVSVAQAADIPNVSMVGFKRMPLEPKTGPARGWAILGVSFVPFDPTLNGVINPDSLEPAASVDYANDQVLTFDPSAQSYVFHYVYSNPASHLIYWTSPLGVAVTTPMSVGQGFWLYSSKDVVRETALAGDALLQGAYTNHIVHKSQLLCYPYMTDVAITNMNLTNGVSSLTGATADKIHVYDAATGVYKVYGLLKNSANVTYWSAFSQLGVPTTNTIPFGTGFWYECRKTEGFDWIVPRPYLNN